MKKMSEAALNLDGSEHQTAEDDESIWDKGTLTRVKEFADLCDEVDDSRAALNAKKKAGILALVDDGFNKDALKAAMRYAKTEEDKRQNFDLTYMFCRKALGVPIQDDLFAAAAQQQVKVAKPKQED